MADTGQGATLTVTDTGSVGAIRSMTLPEFVMEAIETTDLETEDFKTYVKGDLIEPGEITCEVIFDQTDDNLLEYDNGGNDETVFGVSQTITVTWPLDTETNTTNASLTGTGFITNIKMPDMQTGELQIVQYTIKLDGDTEPSYTKEEA